MQFVMLANDKPGSLGLRKQERPAHLAYLTGLGDAVLAAGPFVDGNGDAIGSMIILEAETQATADSMAANDPYAIAGLFAEVKVRPWRWTIGGPEGAT